MRFIIMHKTNEYWEAGGTPSPELIARVGALLTALEKAHVLVGGEGLRETSQGVRLIFSGGKRTIVKGPYQGNHELPAGFTILHAPSLDDAIELATHQAEVLGDIEVDIRPVKEPWDIGRGAKPETLRTVRYMLLRKATPATETGAAPTPSQRASLGELIDKTARTGLQVVDVGIRPSSRGRRYLNSRNGITVIDGPFVETKELLAGYGIVTATCLDDACRWAEPYLKAVEGNEVDVLELE